MFLLLIAIQLTAAQDLPPKYGCTLHHLKSNDPIKQDFHISGRLNYLSPNKLNHNPFNDFDRLLDMGLCLEATVSYHAGVLRTSINCINSTQSSRVPFPRISLENLWSRNGAPLRNSEWEQKKKTKHSALHHGENPEENPSISKDTLHRKEGSIAVKGRTTTAASEFDCRAVCRGNIFKKGIISSEPTKKDTGRQKVASPGPIIIINICIN
ncbi:hypothetical protein quinque_014291 [Culex quinquefasciatus]